MILRNHGLLTCGRTVAEAFQAMYTLEAACRIQILAQSGGTPLTRVRDTYRRLDRKPEELDALWEEADRGNHPWLSFLATWVPVPVSWWNEGGLGCAVRLRRELDRSRALEHLGESDCRKGLAFRGDRRRSGPPATATGSPERNATCAMLRCVSGS